MSSWRAMAVLPNIQIETTVESDLAALVGHSDPCLKAMRRVYPNLHSFLDRFTDAFGVTLRPAVMIQRSDAPDWTRNVDAIASFRDAVSIATIPYNRALEITHARGHRITFANAFWLYPWTLDRHNEHLIASTPECSPFIKSKPLTGSPPLKFPECLCQSRTSTGHCLIRFSHDGASATK